MTSKSQKQNKQISSDSVNSVFDSIKLLVNDFRKDLPGYLEKLILERLSENPQYNDTDTISILHLSCSQQQLDETIDEMPSL